jgi:hypothetical protein
MSLDTGIALLTVAELKSYFEGSSSGSTTYDGKYADLINDVSEFFNNYTHRHLLKQDFTEYYDGHGMNTLYLNNFPVSTSGVAICIDNSRLFTTDLNVSTSDILVYNEEARLTLRNAIFKSGDQNIKIAYTAGYGSTAIPYALKRAAKEMCQFFYSREQKRDKIGIRQESAEGFSRTFETDMPWSVKQILEGYRDWGYP